ncbi:MAG TPA: ABC transporter permease [Bryobacteraceae bacterium]
MQWLTRLEDTLRSLIGRKRALAELDQELRDHLEREIESNLRAGMQPEEARLAAQRLLGPISVYKEECREAHGVGLIESLARDVRYGLRMLRRTPLFTAVAIATLAVGLGANATVFTFIDNVLLRSLPIHDPEQVDALNWGGLANMSFPNYLDFRDRNTVFSSLVACRFVAVSMSVQPRENIRAWGYEATGNYFETLGVQPLLGRFFGTEDDDEPGAHPMVVISHRFWRSHFGGDPGVVGRQVKINGYPFTVIGVARPEFSGTELIVAADYWVPMSMELQVEPGFEWMKWRTSQNAWTLGRRKPGVTRAQAEANLNQIAGQLARTYPNEVSPKGKFQLSSPGLIGQALRGPVTSFGMVLAGVAGLGLLLACVNLAGMLLARASDRRREVGIRLALGAGRAQLLRQLMTESLLLAAIGGALGYCFALAVSGFLSSWRPSFDIPIDIALHPNATVLAFTAAAALLTTILFGLAPALQATRIELIPSLKNELVSPRMRRWSVRDLVVAGQIALSVTLVICSALVVRSLQHALSLNLGFDPNNAASVSFDLGMKGYNQERMRQFDSDLLAKAKALPGIQTIGIINTLPLRRDGGDSEFIWRAEQPIPKPAERRIAMVYNISPGYLRAAGTALLSGRNIDDRDRTGTLPVAIVNQTFARLLFGKENPIGRHVRVSSAAAPLEVIGVVEDGKYQSLGEDPRPAVFLPMAQATTRWTTLVARSSLPASNVTALLRKTVLDLDPEITLFNTGGLKEQLALPLFPARMAAIALGVFGVFAMALAATGLFALMSYAVARRTREIGIRMALGAQRKQVLSSLLGRTLLLCAAGACAGAVITLAAGRLLSAVLYGVSPRDPVTYGAALCLMVVIGVLACWMPASRAMRTDPVQALREE